MIWRYYKKVFAAFGRDFTAATRAQAIGVLLAIAILALQIRYGIIKSGEVHANILAIAWPYLTLLAGLSIYHLVRAPYKVDKDRAGEIGTQISEMSRLKDFKGQVEGNEVQLVVARCNYLPEVYQLQRLADEPNVLRPIGKYEAVTVTLGNPRVIGVPGKVAESVLAKISYICPDGKSFEIVGRWSQSDQLASRDVFASALDLQRMTFNPGDERDLDIAGKFPNGGLYAYNNDSALAPCHPDRLLTGSRIQVMVTLIAAHVQQTIDFELVNAGAGPLQLTLRQQAQPVAQ